MRLRCVWFGCVENEFSNCDRCGCHLHDGGFIDRGKLAPLFDWWWRVRLWARYKCWPWNRCTQCGKRLGLRRPVSDEFCSEKCHDAWLPF